MAHQEGGTIGQQDKNRFLGTSHDCLKGDGGGKKML